MCLFLLLLAVLAYTFCPAVLRSKFLTNLSRRQSKKASPKSQGHTRLEGIATYISIPLARSAFARGDPQNRSGRRRVLKT